MANTGKNAGSSLNRSAISKTLPGILYQNKIFMFTLIQGMNYLKSNFEMETESNDAPHWNDVIFNYKDGKQWKSTFIQAKHKEKEEKITEANFLQKASLKQNNPFSLSKYYLGYLKIQNRLKTKSILLERFIIATNIDIDEKLSESFTEKTNNEEYLSFILNKEQHPDMKNDTSNFKSYKFKENGKFTKTVKSMLKSPDLHHLAQALAVSIYGQKSKKIIDFSDKTKTPYSFLFNKYKPVLLKYVFKCSFVTGETSYSVISFRKNFCNKSKLRGAVLHFHELLENKIIKMKGWSEKLWKGKLMLSGGNFTSLTLNGISEKNPKTVVWPVAFEESEVLDFIEKFRIVVTPNEEGMTECIKKELKLMEGVNNVDDCYSHLFVETIDILKQKYSKPYPRSKAKIFFDKMSSISFDVEAPLEPKYFCGDTMAFNEFLSFKRSTRLVLLHGPHGVGKTQLVRNFIQDYQENFDFNIVWINCEDENSITDSSRRLLFKLIPNFNSIRSHFPENLLIQIAYDFLISKKKVLFVFDNAESYEKLESLNLLPEGENFFTIITSQSRSDANGIKSIELVNCLQLSRT